MMRKIDNWGMAREEARNDSLYPGGAWAKLIEAKAGLTLYFQQ